MITDQQTNTIYFSNILFEEYSTEFNKLAQIIKDAGYKNRTEDFYCSDFTPIQLDSTEIKMLLRNMLKIKVKHISQCIQNNLDNGNR